MRSYAPYLLAFALGLACAHEPGVYENPERQLVYDDAKLSGDCAKACCDHMGTEKGMSGRWEPSERKCSFHSEAESQMICVSWCQRETGNER